MNKFSFTKNKKIFFIFTAVCIVLGIAVCIFKGFNWDVDFAGGAQAKLDIGKKPESAEMKIVEQIAKDNVDKGVSITVTPIGDSTGDYILIKANKMSTEQYDKIVSVATDKFGEGVVGDELQIVSPSVSSGLRKSAIIATVIAVVLMLAYIAIRFKLLSAVAAVACLIHDIFFVFVAYSVFDIPVNTNFIAVVLTILGYSINATIIIFDRVRENNKLMGKSVDFEEKVDRSIKQTLLRSLFTTITTLLTIGMVYILGVTSIKDFALPLIVGIIVGLYSSVCLSGNLWCVLNKLFKKK